MRGQGHNRGRGFSVIELLVVISLIIILVALLVNTVIENRGPIVATKNAMQVLKSIETEYRVLTGQNPVNHLINQDRSPIDWTPATNKFRYNAPLANPTGASATPPDDSIERFVYVVMRQPDNLQKLLSLDLQFVDSDGDKFHEVLDGWENKMHYFSYVDHNDTEAWDNVFPVHGSRLKPRPHFASAGRDGKWGDASAAENSDEWEWAQDNIYSHEFE